MTHSDVTTVDLDIDALSRSDILIAAAETDDEIGCVLRIHLMVEQFLTVYVREKRQPELKAFVSSPREFGQKLAYSTAFGLPLPIAAVAHQINNIRNKMAHNMDQSFNDGDIQQLARLVNQMSDVDLSFTPVEKRTISLSLKRPGETLTYTTEGNRIKFLISSLSFWGTALRWLIEDAARTKIALGLAKTK
ncbi:hypothetical protein J3P96_11925 [Pseudomonas sp. R3-56]|uniref:hypothetical protein n=1 Tax=Pseudomonas sp. R3-56 TaxID=2817401 RepID=UPI003DA825B1